MKNLVLPSLSMLFVILLVLACQPTEISESRPPEYISTVEYTLSPVEGGPSIFLTFSDLDGIECNDPIITGGTLQANQAYTGSLLLIDDMEAFPEVVMEEITGDDAQYQFFFETDTTFLQVSYNDVDKNGDPLGLETILTTGNPGSIQLKITLLKHLNKSAEGVAEGDITYAIGDERSEVIFPIEIE